ncbi:MAG: endolytic transglycosylase MltG [Patescibacteria group bacterium]|nr:endolytic transglycosylase MltG [Patescibacteria group bacterium]
MQNKNIFYTLGIILFLVFFYSLFLNPPSNFKPGTIVQIQPGMGLRNISLELKNENIIRSRLAFEFFAILFGGEKHIISAGYLFDNKTSVWQVAKRIVRGDHHLPPVVATIPEGFNKNEIADVYISKLANFNKNNFLLKAKEGYLFPDTYYFFTTDNEIKVMEHMSKNYEKKITPIRPEILASGRTEKEIITMASIIEKEAKGASDRGIISGILWKRINQGMPLQVDAAPETYKTKGLPENPISNPGLEAIHAAIYPQSSPYLYYLHDKEGNTYYAKTFAEHKANKAKYLNK